MNPARYGEYGAGVLITFSYTGADNTVASTNLPTSDPGVGGADLFSHTVASGDLPAVKANGNAWLPPAYKYLGRLFTMGKNNSGGSATISWRMKKNGSQVATGSLSATANAYYWQLEGNFLGCAVNDLLAIQVWTNAISNVAYTENAYIIEMTSFNFSNSNALLLYNIAAIINDVNSSAHSPVVTCSSTFACGSPNSPGLYPAFPYASNVPSITLSTTTGNWLGSDMFLCDALNSAGNQFFRLNKGDANNSNSAEGGSNASDAGVNTNNLPTRILVRLFKGQGWNP